MGDDNFGRKNKDQRIKCTGNKYKMRKIEDK